MDNTSQRAYVRIRFQLGDKPLDILNQLSTAEGKPVLLYGSFRYGVNPSEREFLRR